LRAEFTFGFHIFKCNVEVCVDERVISADFGKACGNIGKLTFIAELKI